MLSLKSVIFSLAISEKMIFTCPVKLAVTGTTLIRLLGIMSPMIREIGPLMYEWERPYVSDASAFMAAFGPVSTTLLTDAIAATMDWFAAAVPGPAHAGR